MASTATTARKVNRKFATVSGTRNANVLKKVTRLRTKDQMSWRQIGDALEIAPRTARRLFQEANGQGSHHGLLPGKGGRRVATAA